MFEKPFTLVQRGLVREVRVDFQVYNAKLCNTQAEGNAPPSITATLLSATDLDEDATQRESVIRNVTGTAYVGMFFGFIFRRLSLDSLELLSGCRYSRSIFYVLYFLLSASQTVSALGTFMLAMVLNPDVQRAAQAEIDRVIGPERLPEFQDKDNLPIVTAILLETLRYVRRLQFLCGPYKQAHLHQMASRHAARSD